MPLLPLQSALGATVVVLGSTVLHVVAVVQFAALLSRGNWTPAKAAIGLFLGALVWCLLWYCTKPYLEHMQQAELLRQQSMHLVPHLPLSFKLIGLANMSVRSTALIVLAVCGGGLVAQMIRSPNLLGPVCALVALIDIWGVLFQGPVSQIMRRAPNLAEKAMNNLPSATVTTIVHGQRHVHDVLAPSIGVGDYLFIGLLFAALHLNDMNWRGAIKWMTPLIVLSLFCVMTFGWALPGLLFIGLGIAIPNLSYFQYTREENFAMLYCAGFVLVLTALIYYGVMHALPPAPAGR